MPLDVQALVQLTALPKDWYSDERLSVSERRERVRRAAKQGPCGSLPMHKVEDRKVTGRTGEFGVRIYHPSPASDSTLQPAVVYFHGGGFCVGDLESHDGVCRALASLTPCTVVAVDYRLAPGWSAAQGGEWGGTVGVLLVQHLKELQHAFPAAVDDALAAVQWTVDNAAELGIDPDRVAVAGDSAGGNLSAVVSLLARDAGGPRIAFQMLLYPYLGGSPDSHPSLTDFKDEYGLTEHDKRWFLSSYLAGQEGPIDDVRILPLRAPDLAGLPPALIVTAEYDVLRDEGADYARRLVEAGVPTQYICAWGQIHGFFNLTGVTDRSKEAIKECADALAEALKVPRASKTK